MFDLFIVILYLAALTALGLRGGKNVKSASDFTAVSARYGAPVLMMSLSASFIGGGFSSGNAANAFSYGIGSTVALFGFSLSMLVIGLWLAPGVARFSGEATVGGVMRRQYGRRAGTVTGFFSFLCCAGVVGAQMEAMGRLFGVLLGLPAAGGVLLGGAIILLYTTFGGLQSVIIADIIQFVLLALGMPLLVIMAWLRARTGLAGGLVGDGGPAGWALATIPSTYWNPFNGIGVMGFVSLFLTLLCGEALAPPYMQRLLIGKNPRTVARATVASAVFSVPFFVLTGAAGLLAYVLQVTPEAAAAMPALIRAVLPVGLRGFVMAAMVSIMLSAADSFLNSAAVGVMCDIVLPAAALTEKAKLRGLRGANAVTGLAAMALALALPNVFSILMLAYSFWCPVVLVPLAAALLGKHASARTCLAAMGAGLAGSLLWDYALGKPFGLTGAVAGLACNLAVFVIGLVLCKPKSLSSLR